jgi:hypothetical protein
MTIELTLRKISKLVSKIDNRIHETSRDVHDKIVATIVVHDSVSDMIDLVAGTWHEWDEAFNALLRLVDVRVTLRGALGSANQNAGINHLVTELRGLEKKLSIVTQVLRSAPKETQLTTEQLRRRMEARREASKNTTIDVSGGYGRHFGGDDGITANLPVLQDGNIVSLETQVKLFEDQIETTHDKLEQLNATVAIELPDDVVTELQDLDILA